MIRVKLTINTMLRTTQLIEWGAAKLNIARMMLARGHKLSALEEELVASDAAPTRVIAEYAARALEMGGCTLCEALSGTYAPSKHAANTTWSQGRAPDVTTVVFLDDNWDEAKRKSKAASTDQLKQALEAARLAPKPVDQVLNVIIVAPTTLTSDARREIMDIGAVLEGGSADRTLGGDAARVRVMLTRDLTLPLMEHVGVSEHNRLSAAEARRFIAECRVHPLQLSILPTSDPVAVFYDYQPNDVVKITRPTGIEFRIVSRDLA
jgi:DNA-directed RNA polymerase subunit H (RpoH/RPB5)